MVRASKRDTCWHARQNSNLWPSALEARKPSANSYPSSYFRASPRERRCHANCGFRPQSERFFHCLGQARVDGDLCIGECLDPQGNVVVVNVGANDVLTFFPSGQLVNTEHKAPSIFLDNGLREIVCSKDVGEWVGRRRLCNQQALAPTEGARRATAVRCRGQLAEIGLASGIPSATVDGATGLETKRRAAADPGRINWRRHHGS